MVSDRKKAKELMGINVDAANVTYKGVMLMHRMNNLWAGFLLIFSTLFVVHAAIAAEEINSDSELLIGVAPFMSPVALFKRMSPLRDYLTSELNYEVILELSRNVEQLIGRTDAGRYDILFTGPTFALRAFDSGLYVPGAMPELTTAVVVVGSSSAINSIEQLKGKKISVPPKKGAVGSMAPSFFRSKGLGGDSAPEFINYAGHNAAFMAAINGDVDAAFIAEYGYRDAVSMGASAKGIARSKPFPGISMIISNRISADLREKIITAMVRLDKSDQGKMLLKKISFPPFRRYSMQEYENVRNYFTNIGRGEK